VVNPRRKRAALPRIGARFLVIGLYLLAKRRLSLADAAIQRNPEMRPAIRVALRDSECNFFRALARQSWRSQS